MPTHTQTGVLSTCCINGLAWTELHGFRWVSSTFIPAIKNLDCTATSRKKKLLLARSYHLLGDLYFVHDAPIASLRAYMRALRLNLKDAGLLQDIADVLFMLGRYRESWKYEERVRRIEASLHKGDSQVLTDSDRCISHRHPLFAKGDPLWLACERLACGQPRAALRLLKGERGMRSRRLRMMASGATEDVGTVMQDCLRMAKLSGVLEWTSADWFFLPSTLWEEPEFWKMMLVMSSRFVNLGLNSPTSETQGPPELLASASKASWPRIHNIAIRFHLARTLADEPTLRSLSQQFPQWQDCHFALRHLSRTGTPPTRDDLLRISPYSGDTTVVT